MARRNSVFAPKTFGRDTWVWRSLTLPLQDINTVKAFCAQQRDKHIGFNRSGLLRCTTPFPRPTDGSAWFCSELCVNALQQVGLCSDIEGCMTTPSALYEYLSDRGAVMSGSVVLEHRLSQKGLTFKNYKAKTAKAATHLKNKGRMSLHQFQGHKMKKTLKK